MFGGIIMVLSGSTWIQKSGPGFYGKSMEALPGPSQDPFGPVLTQLLGQILVTAEDKKNRVGPENLALIEYLLRS